MNTSSLLALARHLATAGRAPNHVFVNPRDYIEVLVWYASGTERDLINGLERLRYLERRATHRGVTARWPNSLEGLWAPPDW